MEQKLSMDDRLYRFASFILEKEGARQMIVRKMKSIVDKVSMVSEEQGDTIITGKIQDVEHYFVLMNLINDKEYKVKKERKRVELEEARRQDIVIIEEED